MRTRTSGGVGGARVSLAPTRSEGERSALPQTVSRVRAERGAAGGWWWIRQTPGPRPSRTRSRPLARILGGSDRPPASSSGSTSSTPRIAGGPSHPFLTFHPGTRRPSRTDARDAIRLAKREECVRSRRYPRIIVTIEELRISIERDLEDLSEEVERLRAALEALGPGDPTRVRFATATAPRSTEPRRRRASTPGGPPREVRGNGRALTAVAIAAGSREPATSATPSPIACEATTPSREREGMLAQLATIDPAAGAAEGEHTAPATGADRALHELRSELTAALRNGRT
jgi:hypothetical protein